MAHFGLDSILGYFTALVEGSLTYGITPADIGYLYVAYFGKRNVRDHGPVIGDFMKRTKALIVEQGIDKQLEYALKLLNRNNLEFSLDGPPGGPTRFTIHWNKKGRGHG